MWRNILCSIRGVDLLGAPNPMQCVEKTCTVIGAACVAYGCALSLRQRILWKSQQHVEARSHWLEGSTFQETGIALRRSSGKRQQVAGAGYCARHEVQVGSKGSMRQRCVRRPVPSNLAHCNASRKQEGAWLKKAGRCNVKCVEIPDCHWYRRSRTNWTAQHRASHRARYAERSRGRNLRPARRD